MRFRVCTGIYSRPVICRRGMVRVRDLSVFPDGGMGCGRRSAWPACGYLKRRIYSFCCVWGGCAVEERGRKKEDILLLPDGEHRIGSRNPDIRDSAECPGASEYLVKYSGVFWMYSAYDVKCRGI